MDFVNTASKYTNVNTKKFLKYMILFNVLWEPFHFAMI